MEQSEETGAESTSRGQYAMDNVACSVTDKRLQVEEILKTKQGVEDAEYSQAVFYGKV